jgi:hypothetical protein
MIARRLAKTKGNAARGCRMRTLEPSAEALCCRGSSRYGTGFVRFH